MSFIAYAQCWLRPIFGARGNYPEVLCAPNKFICGDFVEGAATGFGCLNILFEIESRQREIFLFVLPRIIVTMWNFLKRRKVITGSLPHAENLLFGLGMGLVLDFIRKESPEIRSTVKSGLMFILGRV